MQVHIVMGSTGEYSDRSEWPVVAYTDLAMAEQHVKFASRYADAVFAARESRWRWDSADLANPYDSQMSMDYTGTRYYVMSVECASELPRIA